MIERNERYLESLPSTSQGSDQYLHMDLLSVACHVAYWHTVMTVLLAAGSKAS